MTTLFGSPPFDSASTLSIMTFWAGGTSTRAVEPGCASAAPSANEAPTTGTDATNGASVPTMSPSRVGSLPWLKMITASAPAASALVALRAKLQPPRWISAIWPGREPRVTKSSGPAGSGTIGAPTAASVKAPSQPLVVARGGTRLMSIGGDGVGLRAARAIR